MDKPTYEELLAALADVLNDFDNEGCEGFGTISARTFNKVEALVAQHAGREPSPVDTTTDEDRDTRVSDCDDPYGPDCHDNTCQLHYGVLDELGCEDNCCEQIECHRCYPRFKCEDHPKCQEFTKDLPDACLYKDHPAY